MLEVWAQPSTATRPSLASMPTAILSGWRRAASRTKSGSRTAAVPMMIRATPLASQPSTVFMSRMPPPSCTGIDAILRRVHGLAGEGAVEIDDVEPFEALRFEARGLRRRIVAEHRRLLHVALDEPHAAAVLEIDRRKQDQGRHFRKFAINARPSFWLFSGWNCVPAMLSRATTAVSGPP